MEISKKQLLEIINNAPEDVSPEKVLDGLVGRGYKIEGYNEKTGAIKSFLKTIGREIAKPFVQGGELIGQGVKAYGSLMKAGGQAIMGDKEKAQETFSRAGERIAESRQDKMSLLGEEIPYIETGKQATGSALNLASNFVGGAGVKSVGKAAIKSTLGQTVKAGSKVGAKAGALYGAGEALSEDRNVIKGSAGGAFAGAVGGAVIPAAGTFAFRGAKMATSPFSTAINKIAPQLDSIANKIETTLIKPSRMDTKQGFKVENIFKYDLGGTLSKSYDKTDKLIAGLVSKADALRSQSTANIDVKKIVSDVGEELQKNRIKTAPNNAKILKALETWTAEMVDIAPNGKMNTVDAQKLKIAIGRLGSWLDGQRDLDSNAMETVSNALYTKFKVAIENSVGDPQALKEINKQLSEIIPISNALIRRIPVANRNSAISLTDIITMSAGVIEPKAWGAFVLNRLAKSGQFANIVNKSSQKLKSGATKLLPIEKGIKDFLNKQQPGLSIKDVSKSTPLKSVDDNLIKEARKYKSADDFIKAQGESVYHGTASKFESFDPKFLGYSTDASSAKGAFWFTDDPATAKSYAIYAAEDAPVQRLLKQADDAEKLAQKTGKESDWAKYDKLVEESEKLAEYDATFTRRQKMANVKEVFVKGDLLEIDAKGKTPQELSMDDNIDSWLNSKIQEAKKNKKAGLKIINIDDAIGLSDRPSTHYAVFDPSQIKTKKQLTEIWNKANKK